MFSFVFRGTDSVSCIFTFFLVYYFSTAGVVWFVVLSYAWYICFQSLGTTRDDLSSKAVYFHLMSWIPPLVLTCVVISLAQVNWRGKTSILSDALVNIILFFWYIITFKTRGRGNGKFYRFPPDKENSVLCYNIHSNLACSFLLNKT
jgi:hypothetical protein